jgi:hypothetical protein
VVEEFGVIARGEVKADFTKRVTIIFSSRLWNRLEKSWTVAEEVKVFKNIGTSEIVRNGGGEVVAKIVF